MNRFFDNGHALEG